MTEQLQPQVTVLDRAKEAVKLLSKLEKADGKAKEFDVQAAKLNAEVMGMAQGQVEQTAERGMMEVVKEKAAAEKKAASIRNKTVEEAQELATVFGTMTHEVAEILRGFKLEIVAHTEADEASDTEESEEEEVA